MDIIQHPNQLSAVLRAARLQLGMTQGDVARHLGVSVQAASKLENNAGRASFDRIHRLCVLLSLDLAVQPRNRVRSPADVKADW